ncbi:Ubiquinone/menaquinone biosynthesis C-methyltransferase UbiE [bioreactor metagenome]|uniref:Ubiquinone/menaquinone biosynthesis C-methyltransferase UbiE n=1 Tax=bioreactor metagenome TaxID=1076179 RepID=A0A644YXD0_9ZZZZ
MIIDSKNIEEAKLIELANPKNKEILEIGCGSGRQAFLLAPFCTKYVATDTNNDVIKSNKSKITKKLSKKLEFSVANGEKLPYSSNSFDTVLMTLCLHEIPIQKQGIVLQEIHRVLKNKGQLLIIDPTEPPDQVQSAFNVVYDNFQFFDHSTVVKHSMWAIKKAISNNLFKINKLSTYKLDWKFDNLKEFVDFIIDCSKDINWDKNKRQFLEKELIKIAKIKNINNSVIIYDGLTVNNLIKIK